MCLLHALHGFSDSQVKRPRFVLMISYNASDFFHFAKMKTKLQNQHNQSKWQINNRVIIIIF